jgi:hypothetical protein
MDVLVYPLPCDFNNQNARRSCKRHMGKLQQALSNRPEFCNQDPFATRLECFGQLGPRHCIQKNSLKEELTCGTVYYLRLPGVLPKLPDSRSVFRTTWGWRELGVLVAIHEFQMYFVCLILDDLNQQLRSSW